MAFFGPGEAIVVLIALELCLRLSNSLAAAKLLSFSEGPFLVGRTSMWASLRGYWFCGYRDPTRSWRTCSHSAMWTALHSDFRTLQFITFLWKPTPSMIFKHGFQMWQLNIPTPWEISSIFFPLFITKCPLPFFTLCLPLSFSLCTPRYRRDCCVLVLTFSWGNGRTALSAYLL